MMAKNELKPFYISEVSTDGVNIPSSESLGGNMGQYIPEIILSVPNASKDDLARLYPTEIRVGIGTNMFGVDDNGLWLGSTKWSTAPFRVSMAGALTATSVTITGMITTFNQAAIPTSLAAGDLWYDSDDGNRLYRAAIAGADEIKAGEWVEVQPVAENVKAARNYQAVVDAAGTGDYTTIGAAITAGATKIYIRSGTYALSADISLPDGVELIGEDAKTTIINCNGAYQVKALGSGGSEFTHLRIANLTFNNSTDANHALYFLSVDKSIIENCIFETGNTVGHILAYACDDIIITRCFFKGTNGGSVRGIYTPSTTGVISNNTFLMGTGDRGIEFGSTLTIVGNLFRNLQTGIYASGSEGNETIITGNYFNGCVDYAVYAASPCIITNNLFYYNGNTTAQPIYVSGNNCLISGNISYDYGYCIYLKANASNNIISNNSKLKSVNQDTGYKSVYIEAGCTDNILLGNQLTSGYTNLGTGTEIANNI